MRRDVTVTGAWTQMVVRGLEVLGVDVRELCRQRKISYAEFVDPDARVPCDEVILLWRAAEQQTGDRNLGLHAAERVQVVVNHIHTHLILSARNLRDGILATRRTGPVFAHGAAVELDERPDAFAIRFEHARGDLPPGRHAVEFAAVLLRRAYGIVHGTPLPLGGVDFTHPCPADQAEHARVFGCPVRFAQSANRLLVPRDVMLRPSPHYSAEMVRHLQDVADDHLARITQPTFSGELRALLRCRLERGPCDADSVAAALHMGLRTLQRRLESDRTSFSEVLDAARREVALELIDQDQPLSTVAARCGFSSARALIRAFRRWTGTTPAAYRAEVGGKTVGPSGSRTSPGRPDSSAR